MAQQVRSRTEYDTCTRRDGVGELWVLVIEPLGHSSMPLVQRLRQRMQVDVAPVPVAPYALAFDGLYDAIIINRPVHGAEGGIALCRELRRLGVTTPIVIVVDQASVDDIVEAINAGADDVIAQGVGMQLYVARLQSLQRRRALLKHGSAQRTGGVLLDLRRAMGHNERGPPLSPPYLQLLLSPAVMNQASVASTRPWANTSKKQRTWQVSIPRPPGAKTVCAREHASAATCIGPPAQHLAHSP